MTCPIKNADGSCPIVEEIVGKKHVPVIAGCEACAAEPSPFDLNGVTSGMCYVEAKRSGQDVPPIVLEARLGDSATAAIDGPGTELAKLIPNFFASKKCSCGSMSRKMNRWGVKGCEENHDRIVNHLVEQAKKIGWVFGDAIPKAIAGHWLNVAIEKARVNEQIASESMDWRTVHPDWFVGITTAPRRSPTLQRCIASVRGAGWQPVIFAEPGSVETNCETIRNSERLGVWRNWYSVAKWSLENTDCKYIVTLQDDIAIHPESFKFTKGIIDDYEGFVSLYTSKKYGYKKQPGVHRVRTKSLWGACAIVFHRETLESVITHPTAVNWLGARPRTKSTREATYQGRKDNPRKIANSDTAIGKAMNARKLPMWFVNPSPAKHIAIFSSISHGSNEGRRNCNPCSDFSIGMQEQVRGEE